MVSEGPLNLTLPSDLADMVRGRVASGQFTSAEEVVRAALALMSAHNAGDDAATIRQKIDAGWQQAQAGTHIDGDAAMKRWREREEQRKSGRTG